MSGAQETRCDVRFTRLKYARASSAMAAPTARHSVLLKDPPRRCRCGNDVGHPVDPGTGVATQPRRYPWSASP